MKCEYCDLEIDQGCKDLQIDTGIEGWCEVCDKSVDDDYYEDEYCDEWGNE